MNFEILRVVKKISDEIEREKLKLIRLKNLVSSSRADLDGLPKSQNKNSRVETLAAAIVDSKNKISELVQIRLTCQLELADWLTGQIPNERQYQVLYFRYGLCKSFAEISRDLNYSESSVFRLHKQGLRTLGINARISDEWAFDRKVNSNLVVRDSHMTVDNSYTNNYNTN